MLQLKIQLERWQNKIGRLLTFTSYGLLTGLLTPSVISIDTLEEVVKHRSINSTIFYNKPELLYQHGELTLISISPSLDQFHFTLTFPDLTQDNITDVFEVNQVGFLLPNATSCFEYDVKKYVILKGTSFTPIDISQCVNKQSGLLLCNTNFPRKVDTAKACLTQRNITCPLNKVLCSTKYITNPSGVLIFSSDDITVVRRANTGMATVVKSDSYTNTAFFPWTEVALVMVGGSVIEAPDAANQVQHLISPFHMTNAFNQTVFSPIKITFNTSMLSQIVSNQNATIKSLKANLGQIPSFYKSAHNGHTWPYTALGCIVLVVIILTVLIITLCCKTFQILGSGVMNDFSGPGGANLRAALAQMAVSVPV